MDLRPVLTRDDLGSEKQNALYLKLVPLDSVGNGWLLPERRDNYRPGN